MYVRACDGMLVRDRLAFKMTVDRNHAIVPLSGARVGTNALDSLLVQNTLAFTMAPDRIHAIVPVSGPRL